MSPPLDLPITLFRGHKLDVVGTCSIQQMLLRGWLRSGERETVIRIEGGGGREQNKEITAACL